MRRGEDHNTSWRELFTAWRERPYPSCPSGVGDVDLVMLDADTAGLLLRLSRGEGGADASTLHLLRESRGRLTEVVGRLSGECRHYFEELEDIVLRALEHHRGGLL